MDPINFSELGNTKALREEAYDRGKARGANDRASGAPDRSDDILSGEWAGESIPELLGDIIDRLDPPYEWTIARKWEIEDAYIEGYADGYGAQEGEQS